MRQRSSAVLSLACVAALISASASAQKPPDAPTQAELMKLLGKAQSGKPLTKEEVDRLKQLSGAMRGGATGSPSGASNAAASARSNRDADPLCPPATADGAPINVPTLTDAQLGSQLGALQKAWGAKLGKDRGKLDALLAKQPDVAHSLSGAFYLQQQGSAAVYAAAFALSKNRGDAVLAANLGSLLQQLGDAKTAALILKTAHAKHPKDRLVTTNLGWAYFELGDRKNARTTFERVTAAGGNTAGAELGLGLIARCEGRADDAMGHFGRSRAQRSSPVAEEAVRQIRRASNERDRDVERPPPPAGPRFPPPGEGPRLVAKEYPIGATAKNFVANADIGGAFLAENVQRQSAGIQGMTVDARILGQGGGPGGRPPVSTRGARRGIRRYPIPDRYGAAVTELQDWFNSVARRAMRDGYREEAAAYELATRRSMALAKRCEERLGACQDQYCQDRVKYECCVERAGLADNFFAELVGFHGAYWRKMKPALEDYWSRSGAAVSRLSTPELRRAHERGREVTLASVYVNEAPYVEKWRGLVGSHLGKVCVAPVPPDPAVTLSTGELRSWPGEEACNDDLSVEGGVETPAFEFSTSASCNELELQIGAGCLQFTFSEDLATGRCTLYAGPQVNLEVGAGGSTFGVAGSLGPYITLDGASVVDVGVQTVREAGAGVIEAEATVQYSAYGMETGWSLETSVSATAGPVSYELGSFDSSAAPQ